MSDRDSVNSELSAVMEYLATLNGTCVTDAELDDTCRSESNAVRNFAMLKQSLEDSLAQVCASPTVAT